MKSQTVLVRITDETRKAAKLAAALTDEKMLTVIERAVKVELDRIQGKQK